MGSEPEEGEILEDDDYEDISTQEDPLEKLSHSHDSPMSLLSIQVVSRKNGKIKRRVHNRERSASADREKDNLKEHKTSSSRSKIQPKRKRPAERPTRETRREYSDDDDDNLEEKKTKAIENIIKNNRKRRPSSPISSRYRSSRRPRRRSLSEDRDSRNRSYRRRSSSRDSSSFYKKVYNISNHDLKSEKLRYAHSSKSRGSRNERNDSRKSFSPTLKFLNSDDDNKCYSPTDIPDYEVDNEFSRQRQDNEIEEISDSELFLQQNEQDAAGLKTQIEDSDKENDDMTEEELYLRQIALKDLLFKMKSAEDEVQDENDPKCDNDKDTKGNEEEIEYEPDESGRMEISLGSVHSDYQKLIDSPCPTPSPSPPSENEFRNENPFSSISSSFIYNSSNNQPQQHQQPNNNYHFAPHDVDMRLETNNVNINDPSILSSLNSAFVAQPNPHLPLVDLIHLAANIVGTNLTNGQFYHQPQSFQAPPNFIPVPAAHPTIPTTSNNTNENLSRFINAMCFSQMQNLQNIASMQPYMPIPQVVNITPPLVNAQQENQHFPSNETIQQQNKLQQQQTFFPSMDTGQSEVSTDCPQDDNNDNMSLENQDLQLAQNTEVTELTGDIKEINEPIKDGDDINTNQINQPIPVCDIEDEDEIEILYVKSEDPLLIIETTYNKTNEEDSENNNEVVIEEQEDKMEIEENVTKNKTENSEKQEEIIILPPPPPPTITIIPKKPRPKAPPPPILSNLINIEKNSSKSKDISSSSSRKSKSPEKSKTPPPPPPASSSSSRIKRNAPSPPIISKTNTDSINKSRKRKASDNNNSRPSSSNSNYRSSSSRRSGREKTEKRERTERRSLSPIVKIARRRSDDTKTKRSNETPSRDFSRYRKTISNHTKAINERANNNKNSSSSRPATTKSYENKRDSSSLKNNTDKSSDVLKEQEKNKPIINPVLIPPNESEIQQQKAIILDTEIPDEELLRAQLLLDLARKKSKNLNFIDTLTNEPVKIIQNDKYNANLSLLGNLGINQNQNDTTNNIINYQDYSLLHPLLGTDIYYANASAANIHNIPNLQLQLPEERPNLILNNKVIKRTITNPSAMKKINNNNKISFPSTASTSSNSHSNNTNSNKKKSSQSQYSLDKRKNENILKSMKITVPNREIKNIQRIIIPLGQDDTSEEEEEESSPNKNKNLPHNFQESLDQLLKSAREDSAPGPAHSNSNKRNSLNSSTIKNKDNTSANLNEMKKPIESALTKITAKTTQQPAKLPPVNKIKPSPIKPPGVTSKPTPIVMNKLKEDEIKKDILSPTPKPTFTKLNPNIISTTTVNKIKSPIKPPPLPPLKQTPLGQFNKATNNKSDNAISKIGSTAGNLNSKKITITAPKAVRHLSKSKQFEYAMLKKQLLDAEKNQNQKKKTAEERSDSPKKVPEPAAAVVNNSKITSNQLLVENKIKEKPEKVLTPKKVEEDIPEKAVKKLETTLTLPKNDTSQEIVEILQNKIEDKQINSKRIDELLLQHETGDDETEPESMDAEKENQLLALTDDDEPLHLTPDTDSQKNESKLETEVNVNASSSSIIKEKESKALKEREELYLKEKLLRASLLRKMDKFELAKLENSLKTKRKDTVQNLSALLIKISNVSDKKVSVKKLENDVKLLKRQLMIKEAHLRNKNKDLSQSVKDVRASTTVALNLHKDYLGLSKKCLNLGKSLQIPAEPPYKLPFEKTAREIKLKLEELKRQSMVANLRNASALRKDAGNGRLFGSRRLLRKRKTSFKSNNIVYSKGLTKYSRESSSKYNEENGNVLKPKINFCDVLSSSTILCSQHNHHQISKGYADYNSLLFFINNSKNSLDQDANRGSGKLLDPKVILCHIELRGGGGACKSKTCQFQHMTR